MERNGATTKAAELESVAFAAAKWGMSRQRVYQMFDNGSLDFYKMGNRKMIHRRDIERIMRERQSAGFLG